MQSLRFCFCQTKTNLFCLISDLLCEHITLDASDPNLAENNVIYPFSTGFVAISLTFPTVGANVVELEFTDNGATDKYTVKVDMSVPVTFTLTTPLGDTSDHISQAVPANVDLQFWVDFTSDKFVVGMGTEIVLEISHLLIYGSQMSIIPSGSTIVSATVCSKRGKSCSSHIHL